MLKTWITISHSNGLLGQEVGNTLKLDSLCKKNELSGWRAGDLPPIAWLCRTPTATKPLAWHSPPFTLPVRCFYELTPLTHFIHQRTKARANFATFGTSQARAGFCHLKMNTPRCLHGGMSPSPPLCCSLRWLGAFILWSICLLK